MPQVTRRFEEVSQGELFDGIEEFLTIEEQSVGEAVFALMGVFGASYEKITMQVAREIADAFRRIPGFPGQEIYCFGSVARDGEGNDLDLAITVPEYLWCEFRQRVLEEIQSTKLSRVVYGFGTATTRFEIGYGLLGGRYAPFELPYSKRWQIDLFLFPTNWRHRLGELQDALPHSDPNFMCNIAVDAVPL